MRGSHDPNAGKFNSKNTVYSKMIRSRYCALSNQPLCVPIVACELGYLYNKEAVLSALLHSAASSPTDANTGAGAGAKKDGGGISTLSEFRHVSKMKDVKEVVFYTNPQYEHAKSTGSSSSSGSSSGSGGSSSIVEGTTSSLANEGPSPYACPVTGIEFNGRHPFVVLWTTGYVLSEKALKVMGAPALQAEYGPFNQTVTLSPPAVAEAEVTKATEEAASITLQDVVKLLPDTEAERTAAAMDMECRRRNAALLKASKGKGKSRDKSKSKSESKRKSNSDGCDKVQVQVQVQGSKRGREDIHPRPAKSARPSGGGMNISLAQSIATAAAAEAGIGTDAKTTTATYSSLFHSSKNAPKPTANELFNQARGRNQ